MRKFIGLALIAIVLAAGSACSGSGSSSDSGSGSTSTTGLSTSQCSALGSEYSSIIGEFADAMESVTYATPALIAAVKSTGRQAIETGRALIAACPQYSSASSDLDDLEKVVESL